MTHELSLGYSTCPNDTLMFYGLAHQKVDCRGVEYRITLADVEALNQNARQGKLDVTKLSFAAIGNLLETYALLNAGAALGRGCGPLIVSRPDISLSDIYTTPIAVPGLWTTACMLLGLYAKKPLKMIPMIFSNIMPAIQDGKVAVGVIIHEGRFTFQQYGLKCLIDLGQWWEKMTALPIPLGGIAIKRSLSSATIHAVEQTLVDSILYGLSHKKTANSYISCHAQEMSQDVIDQHISLYVNDFSVSLGDEGIRAIRKLFDLATEKGILPKIKKPLFARDDK